MPLKLLPAGESDAPRSAAIESVSYGPNPVGSACFPGPFPDPGAGTGSSRADQLAETLRSDPACRWWKVVDTDIGDGVTEDAMVSFAEWFVWDTPQPPAPPVAWGPGTNPDACEAFFGGMRELRNKRFEGKPYVYFKLLHTHPDHKRRGAGSILLKKVLSEAESLNLPCYLEASVQGRPLYEKFGFRHVDVFTVDLSQWGGPSTIDTPLMLWEPAKKE